MAARTAASTAGGKLGHARDRDGDVELVRHASGRDRLGVPLAVLLEPRVDRRVDVVGQVRQARRSRAAGRPARPARAAAAAAPPRRRARSRRRTSPRRRGRRPRGTSASASATLATPTRVVVGGRRAACSRNRAAVITPSVPSEPTSSPDRSYPVESLASPDSRVSTDPSASTTSSPTTWARVSPAAITCSPPAFVATRATHRRALPGGEVDAVREPAAGHVALEPPDRDAGAGRHLPGHLVHRTELIEPGGDAARPAGRRPSAGHRRRPGRCCRPGRRPGPQPRGRPRARRPPRRWSRVGRPRAAGPPNRWVQSMTYGATRSRSTSTCGVTDRGSQGVDQLRPTLASVRSAPTRTDGCPGPGGPGQPER